MPNKIDSNITGLSYAEESALGTLPGALGADAIWRALEPNSYSQMGGKYPTMARAPINPSRQRQKGTTVDLDAGAGFNHDWLHQAMLRPAQSFFFAAARQKASTQTLAGVTVAITGVTALNYTAAAGLDVFKVNDVVLASGFGVAANNGLKVPTAVAAGVLTVAAAIEAAPPAAAKLETVGVQFTAGDVAVTLTGTTAVNLTSVAYNFTTLGLVVGEWVWLGGDTAITTFDNNSGYARVSAIAANLLSFDQTTWAPQAEAGGVKTVRMFFGTVLKNESTAALIVTKSVQFERTLGNDGGGVQSEYVLGCVGNELALNVPQADKLNVDLTYVGIDSEQRSGADGVKAGTRVAVVDEDAFNTSLDIYRQYLTIVNPLAINSAALFGYVQDANLKISNGVKPNKALGVLGAFDVSAGDFVVSGSLTAYFTSIAAIAAIKNNSDIGWNVICAKQNVGFVFDIPLMSIDGGELDVQKDEPIMIPVENQAYENGNGYTLMYCNFPYLPTAAMPA